MFLRFVCNSRFVTGFSKFEINLSFFWDFFEIFSKNLKKSQKNPKKSQNEISKKSQKNLKKISEARIALDLDESAPVNIGQLHAAKGRHERKRVAAKGRNVGRRPTRGQRPRLA